MRPGFPGLNLGGWGWFFFMFWVGVFPWPFFPSLALRDRVDVRCRNNAGSTVTRNFQWQYSYTLFHSRICIRTYQWRSRRNPKDLIKDGRQQWYAAFL